MNAVNLAKARILVTNDDGIHAQGLKVLEAIARELSDDVWVVAPEMEQSAASHSLTINRPLRLRKLDERRFTVDGTPTDCVLLAVNHVMRDARPTLVLSGVNQGSNIGEDVTYSGTVAAAMEATILGVPAIAFSQYYGPDHPVRWSTAEHWAPEIIRRLVAVGWDRNVLMNVNFPDVPADKVTGIEVVRQGKRKIGDELAERLDPRGEPYIWIGAQRAEDRSTKGTDIEAVVRGAVSVTPLRVDLTDRDSMAALSGVFATG